MSNMVYPCDDGLNLSSSPSPWPTGNGGGGGVTGLGSLPFVECATSTLEEGSDTTILPPDMTFDEDNLMSVVVYCLLFVAAAVGNLTVFLTLFRNRHRKSRVNLFIMHLSLADLIVTFIMLPLETIWHMTVSWRAGDIACRLLMFFRAFGLYLSSFILVVISLDRYFAILHPLSMSDAERRGKIMLILAWLFSGVASLPQSVIFHVEYHPRFPWFAQCVTFNFFPTPAHELAYNLFNIITVYGLPLVVIIIAYSIILCEMTRKTRESKEDSSGVANGQLNTRRRERLRRSGVGKIERARIRTLKMTVMIVAAFIMCWTPYFVMSAWWWFDKNSAEKIDPKVQKGLFMFAVSNSCMDPLVYGLFSLDFKREFMRCCCCLKEKARQEEMTSQVIQRFSLRRTQTSSIHGNTHIYSPLSTRKLAYAATRRPGGGSSGTGNTAASPPGTATDAVARTVAPTGGGGGGSCVASAWSRSRNGNVANGTSSPSPPRDMTALL